MKLKMYLSGMFFLACVLLFASKINAAPVGKVGVLLWDAKSIAYVETIAGIKEKMHELGYPESSVVIYTLEGATKAEKLAKEQEILTTLNADPSYKVIATSGTDCTKAAIAQVKVKPLVFFTVTDPIASGLLNSLISPEANVTGSSIQIPMEIVMNSFQKVAPKAKKIGIIHQTGDTAGLPQIKDLQAIQSKFGIEIIMNEVKDQTELALKAKEMSSSVDAFFLQGEPMLSSYGKDLVDVANANKKLTIALKDYIVIKWAATMGKVVDFKDCGYSTAMIFDDILKGKKPAQIPVSVPQKFPLIINLKSVQSVGLNVSDEVLSEADQIIE